MWIHFPVARCPARYAHVWLAMAILAQMLRYAPHTVWCDRCVYLPYLGPLAIPRLAQGAMPLVCGSR